MSNRMLVFHIALALIACLTARNSYAQEKVAVIVSAGDLAQLENSMKSLERQARKTYEELGYKVILLGGADKKGANLSPEVLKRTLGGLKGVKDLRFDFIGHGALVPVPENKFKGEEVSVSPERRANGHEFISPDKKGKMVWYAANSSTADQLYYGQKAAMFGYIPEELPPISHENVKESLAEFRAKNPEALTTMNLLNCFSGAMAQELRKTPNTIVFSNSPHNEVALDLSHWVKSGGSREGFVGSSNGLSFYYDAVGAPGISELSLLEARKWANTHMKQNLKDDMTLGYLVGRSPVLESVIGWCEDGKPGRRTEPRTESETNSRSLPEAKAFQLVADEIKSQRMMFEYARKVPLFFDPNKTAIQALEEEYDQCMNPVIKPDGEKPGSGGNWVIKTMSGNRSELEFRAARHEEWKKQRASYADNPHRPLQMLFQKYGEILKDTSQHGQIFDRVKKSTERDVANLQNQGLPKERWGAIEKFINGMNDGSITQEKVIGDLEKQVAGMRNACSKGAPESSPCIDFMFVSRNMGEFLIGSSSNEDKCSKEKRYFECLYSGSPSYPLWQTALEYYWGKSTEPKPIPLEEQCSTRGLVKARKTDANIKADEACVEEFRAFAPDEEWQNLERIFKLGERDARGYAPKKANDDSMKRKDVVQ